jgi:hypothetical protein
LDFIWTKCQTLLRRFQVEKSVAKAIVQPINKENSIRLVYFTENSTTCFPRQVQNAGCRLQVGISQVGNFVGWNFGGWGFCRLEFCRLPGILQVDDANLKLHHYKVF